jgi:glycopeptide antibiotics resistance protein
MRRSKTVPLLTLYVIYLLIATFHPFVFPSHSTQSATRFLTEFLSVTGPVTKDFAQNVALFIPFGALLCCSLKSLARPLTGRIILSFAAGGALSLLIELGQIFFTRYPAVSDVIANSIGSLCGALIAAICPVQLRGAIPRFWDNVLTSKCFVLSVVTFGTLPLVLSMVQSPWPGFGMWVSSFPFQLANEATMDRPWLGRIHLVAVYNRALSLAEIGNNFRSGFSSDATKNRAKNGLVALYTFAEGGGDIVHDVSGFDDALNLSIVPATHVRWLSDSNGIEIVQPAIIKSQAPADKLRNAFRSLDQLSIEAWFAPDNLTQSGPARLISFSGDLKRHNFTLGQQGSDVMFWLRTLISGLVGGAGLQTHGGSLTLDVSHVVATYSRGLQRLYINGNEYPKKLDVTKDVVIAFGAPKTVLAQIGYGFFYFFPVGLFVAAFLSIRYAALTSAFLIAVATAMGLMVTTELVQCVLFDRAIDFSLIGYGLIIAMLGSLAGAGLPKNRLPAANEISSLSVR